MERDFAREHSFNPHRGLPESLRCELRRVLLGDCEEEAPAMTFRQIVMRAHGGWVPASEARHFHNHQRFVCRTMHALLRRGDWHGLPHAGAEPRAPDRGFVYAELLCVGGTRQSALRPLRLSQT